MSSSIFNCVHRGITGIEASSLLMNEGKDGSFLIRPSSSNADDLSLSVRRDDEVIHIKIQTTGDFIDLFGGEQFASLPQLIDYYMNGEGQHMLMETSGRAIRLKYPIPAPKHRGERWFHCNITSQEAEDRLKSLKKEGTFLVRESSSKKGDFVLSYLNKEHNVIHVMISKEKGLYIIGDGVNSFGTLSDLIDFYRTNDMTVKYRDNDKYTFRLQKSLIAGAVPIKKLESKIVELEREFDDRDKKRNGFWEEFEYIQSSEQNSTYSRTMTAGYAPENKVKNRYRNILPYDETRVKLKDSDPKVPGSDYINANYISAKSILPHVFKSYIASQGCVKVSVPDFWNMVWQEGINIIVMTTELVENGKNKCFLYWSETPSEPLVVELYSGPLSIKTGEVSDKKDYTLREFIVTHNNQTRTVYQYHHRKWPDKCTPKDSSGVVEFVNDINRQALTLKQLGMPTSPWLIHCSAGIGRTGTFILIDLLISHIQSKGLDCTIDVPKLLMDIRTQRAGLVQTDKQYTFVYKAVLLFVKQYFKKTQDPASVPDTDPMSLYGNIDANLNHNFNKNSGNTNAVKPMLAPRPNHQVYENVK